ncbi:MAG: proton-conducting transporter membrane subunit [Candidatus Margulisiibacteriota bacterium]
MTYLFIFVPFILLVILNLLPKRLRAAAFYSTLAMLAAQVVFSPFEFVKPAQMEVIFGFNLIINNLSVILLMISGLIAGVSLVAGWATLKDDDKKFNFISLILLSVIGLNGIAMVKDVFSLYVFIEATAVATFILISLNMDKPAFEGILKYLILSVVASTLMLTSIALLIISCGSLGFSDIRAFIYPSGGTIFSQAAVALFICGLLIKGGLVPFHGWVADAYTSAPASVSILLAGIITKASGVFTLIKFMTSTLCFTTSIMDMLLFVGALSIVFGALAALGQKDIKRILAYSSISQMGYIVIALGTGTPLGIFAALFHFINHAIFKSQLFVNAAAVEEQTGTRDMDKMGGLAQVMPVTGVTSAIASLSTAGIPPLAGFWSKLLIIISLWLSGNFAYAVIAVLASLLTLAYFLYFQRSIFFGKVPADLANVREADALLVSPAVLLSALTVGIGLAFPFILKLFMRQ